ncbi:MAG: hypothetical protein WBX17_03430 [Microbacterium sp.]
MAELVVEIHVPLTPMKGLGEGEYPLPFLETIENFLFGLDEVDGGGEMYDDGEQLDAEYLYFVWQASENELIDLARRIADLPGVPAGVYAVVTDSESEEMGVGERVTL